jgi:hypothetical protein
MDLVRPKSVVELGLMEGSPPKNGGLVTLANWQDAPFNRWGFLHVRELIPTANISCRDMPAYDLPRAERDLEGFVFEHEGDPVTFSQMLDATFTDGVIVVHQGKVIYEAYVDGMAPATTHLLMSVSKSLTATLAGVLVGQGKLDPDATVPDYVDGLWGTSWEGCKVQHLLDMRSGTRFDESDYDNLESDGRLFEEVMNWRPRSHPDLPNNLCEYIAGLENEREHGGPFEYRSILTEVLGWVLERCGGGRFAELFSKEIWSKIGAEQDAEITVDGQGFAVADGGFCTTLRDLARFGLMHLQGGEIAGRRVVPESWVHRLLSPDAELIDAFEPSHEARERSGAFYHDKWWVIDAERGIYSGYGINGQQLLIHRPSSTVVAKFSTWPRGWVEDIALLQDAGLFALCGSLS